MKLIYHLGPEDFLALYMNHWSKARAAAQGRFRYALRVFFDFRLKVTGIVLLIMSIVLLTMFIKLRRFNPLSLAEQIGILGLSAGLGVFLLLSSGTKAARRRYLHKVQQLVRKQEAAGIINSARENELTIGPEGFLGVESRDTQVGDQVTEKIVTQIAWTDVDSIDVAEQHAFVSVAGKGWLIVPKKAFADEDRFLDFVGKAIEYASQAGATLD